MITFNNIGRLGGLGNQMFQYASLKGIARHHGYDFATPPRDVFIEDDSIYLTPVSKDVYWWKMSTHLYDCFGLDKKNKVGLFPNQVVMERMHNFDEELFNKCPDNVDIFGYYQTPKYFNHIEDELKDDFTFDEELKSSCEDFISEDMISLHIRRGDYVNNPNHPIPSFDYYEKALSKFPPNIPVIVFSDDYEWAKEQSFFKPDRFSISEGNTTDADLCLMSLCKYHIIANSSFSWWGAWLAKSEKIIAPKNWFGGDSVNKNVNDMEFGDWSWI